MEPENLDSHPLGSESVEREAPAAHVRPPDVSRHGTSPFAPSWGKDVWSWIWLAVWGGIFLLLWPACGGVPEVMLILLLIAVVIAMFAVIAVWILGPVDQAAKETRGPLQFTLVDFLCLFVLVQLPMALIHGLLTEAELAMRWILDVYAWFSVVAFWGLSVQVLSRAGIRRPRYRAIFLCFVAPSAILGTIAVPMLTAAAALAVYESLRTGDFPLRNRDGAVGAIVYLLLLVFIYLSGRLTRRMVAAGAAAKEDLPAEDGVMP